MGTVEDWIKADLGKALKTSSSKPKKELSYFETADQRVRGAQKEGIQKQYEDDLVSKRRNKQSKLKEKTNKINKLNHIDKLKAYDSNANDSNSSSSSSSEEEI